MPEIPDKNGNIETVPSLLEDLISIGILSEFIIYYADISDESDQYSEAVWDFYLSSLELDLKMEFTSWLEGRGVAEIQDVGRRGEDAVASISEIYATVQYPNFPIYFVGGKRTQPFGVFEDRLIGGPLTEDLYEIDETGATLGVVAGRYSTDVSLTIYEGQDIIANLADSGVHEFREGRRKEEGINSYILNVSFMPIPEQLDLSVFYSHEPGDGNDNNSIGGALTFRCYDFEIDVEYITALKREFGENGVENLESAWFVGLVYKATKTLDLATRYEVFDDDQEGSQDEVIKHRSLAGLNYALTDQIALSLEYSHSRYERGNGSSAAKRKNEVQVQLAIEY